MNTNPATLLLQRTACLAASLTFLLAPGLASAAKDNWIAPAGAEMNLASSATDPALLKAEREEVEKERASQLAGPSAVAAPEAARPIVAVPVPNGPFPVRVTATAGTTGPTDYANLGAAVAAINAGTHQGAITVSILGSSTETAAVVINSNGAGTASYTSILIQPTVDGATISGPTVTGRGLIELNGADNVTIDGDNPNTAGTNRNLTIQNTAANTVTFTSVIRVALAATIVTSADNNIFRNLILTGSATGRNITGASSATGTENTTYGIVATGGASTTSATTAPSALASTSTTIGTGATALNLIIDNNRIFTAARAIAVQGSSTTVFPGLTITRNQIGNSTAAAVDQVYSVGITAQGSANGVISLNTVAIEGFVASSSAAANRAIDVGGVSAVGTFLIERNMVTRVRSNAPDFWVAHGINLGGGNGHTVQNNFVSDVALNSTSGGFYSTTFNAAGIRVGSGLNHKIYHNSVNMFGTIPGATPAISAAFMITASTLTGIDVRNNIFVNTLSNGSATSAHVAVYLPSAATSSMALTINNNDNFGGAAPIATQGVGQVGTTAGTGFFTYANFDPTMTTPTTNFRSYTSSLSAAGTNDNASKKVDPQFVSNTDLHINAASPMVDMGASVGVAQDIDGQNRVGIPDIGADEPNGVAPPANDIAAISIVSPANGSSRPVGAAVTPQATFSNVGTAAQTNVMVQFTITGPGGFTYTDTQTIAAINPSQTITVTFAATPPLPAAGIYNMTAAVITADQNPNNDQVVGNFRAVQPVGGSYNVPGDFASLTNPGGIFDAMNTAGVSSSIVINIVADLTGENGTVALNQPVEAGAGGYSIRIRPVGGARSITGSSTTAILRVNGADRVTIDGSLQQGTPVTEVGGDPSIRSLTVTNTSTTATAGAVISVSEGSSTDGADALLVVGAQNFTLKNVNVVEQDPTQTLIGLHIGGNAVGSAPTIANNNNARVENCSFRRAFVGVFNDGISAVNPATGNVITNNDLAGTGVNRLRRNGLFFFNHNGIQVTGNDIGGISTDESADGIGIVAGIQNVTTTAATSGGVFNAIITGNRINGVAATSTTGFSAVGIAVGGDPAGANTIANNMISNITAPATSPDIVAGIFVAGVTGSNTKIYFNSVALTGDRGAVLSQLGSYGVAIAGATAPLVDLQDNILYNVQTSGGGAAAKSYALGTQAVAANLTNLTSNRNLFYFAGANLGGFRVGSLDTAGTDFATLAAWQAATGKDVNSFFGDPLFVNPVSNLHIGCTSPAIGGGVPVGGITTDFDGQTRHATPDIGADELVAPSILSAVSRKTHGIAGDFNIVLPGVESRSGGPNGDYQIIITFALPVTAPTATVSTGTGTVASTTGSGTNSITVNLTGVSNMQYVTVTLQCVNDGTSMGDVAVTMGVLVGDANGDTFVNSADAGFTRNRAGQMTDGTNYRADYNADGFINSADAAIVRARSGNALP